MFGTVIFPPDQQDDDQVDDGGSQQRVGEMHGQPAGLEQDEAANDGHGCRVRPHFPQNNAAGQEHFDGAVAQQVGTFPEPGRRMQMIAGVTQGITDPVPGVVLQFMLREVNDDMIECIGIRRKQEDTAD